MAPLFTLGPVSIGYWELAIIAYAVYRLYAYAFPAPVHESKLRKPKGAAELAEAKASAGAERLVVVDFFATWCGPCVAIAPFLDELQDAHPDVLFLKVQEDESRDVILAEKIRAFPTFRFYLAGRCVKEMLGADRAGLKEAVETLKAVAARGEAGKLQEVGGAGSGSGGGGGGGGGDGGTCAVC
jgi:thiol-disulfide isomerase/thioredoxin